jgi:hypothetical protein
VMSEERLKPKRLWRKQTASQAIPPHDRQASQGIKPRHKIRVPLPPWWFRRSQLRVDLLQRLPLRDPERNEYRQLGLGTRAWQHELSFR